MRNAREPVSRRSVMRVGAASLTGMAAIGAASLSGGPETRKTTAPVVLTLAQQGGVDIREFGPINTADPTFDALPVFRKAIETMPEGATLWVPPVPAGQAYRFSDELDIDRHVNVAGSWGRDKNDSNGDEVHGSVLSPIDDAAQRRMTSLVRVRRSWVHIDGIALLGTGAGAGSIGLRFAGDDDTRHTHGAIAHRVVSVGFGAGVCFGDWSDHATLDGCAVNGNTDGVTFERDNHFDHFIMNSLIDGNVRSSVYLPDTVGTDNLTVIRSHLGFSKYGILQEDTGTEMRGFSGLVLLASPIEFVSEQHVKIATSGNIRIEGGYWTWDGTPANPAFSIRNITHGPVWLSPRFDPGFPNPNSPALVDVSGYANHPVHVLTPLNEFARSVRTGALGLPVVQGARDGNAALTSLLAALGAAGIVEDATTP